MTLPVDSDNIKFARADRTDRQTHSTKQKTLLVFAGSWNHVCSQLLSHSPASSSPSQHHFPHIPLPPSPSPSSLSSATSMWLSSRSSTALCKWTLILTLTRENSEMKRGLEYQNSHGGEKQEAGEACYIRWPPYLSSVLPFSFTWYISAKIPWRTWYKEDVYKMSTPLLGQGHIKWREWQVISWT